MKLKLNTLYLVPIRVKSIDNSQMPQNMMGAIALCFSSAPNHLIAVSNAVDSLKDWHYEFIDLAGPVQEIDHHRWNEYVHSVWSEFSAQLPSANDVMKHVSKGTVFYGPLLGWEEDDTASQIG